MRSPAISLFCACDTPLETFSGGELPQDFEAPSVLQTFATAYSQAGGVIEIAVYPGVGHGFGREPGLNTDRALALIKSFIARRLAEG